MAEVEHDVSVLERLELCGEPIELRDREERERAADGDVMRAVVVGDVHTHARRAEPEQREEQREHAARLHTREEIEDHHRRDGDEEDRRFDA